MTHTDSLSGIPYVKMRLAQIASGDYRACGLSAEEVARDAFKELIKMGYVQPLNTSPAQLTKTTEIVSSENLSNDMGDASTRKDEEAQETATVETSPATVEPQFNPSNDPAPKEPQISVYASEIPVVEKKDWLCDNYSGNWELFINPAAIYDALHATHEPILAKIAESIHYPACWDDSTYPTLYDALYELAGCVGCAECAQGGRRPDADQKPTEPVSVDLGEMVEKMKDNFEWFEPSDMEYRRAIKAVLDAAGVKYVD